MGIFWVEQGVAMDGENRDAERWHERGLLPSLPQHRDRGPPGNDACRLMNVSGNNSLDCFALERTSGIIAHILNVQGGWPDREVLP